MGRPGGARARMKQGLSLRVSQHLALTPQLQQSIRQLQLSTLELSQEVEQMLDFLAQLQRRELQQADGLLQLGRERQVLREPKCERRFHAEQRERSGKPD